MIDSPVFHPHFTSLYKAHEVTENKNWDVFDVKHASEAHSGKIPIKKYLESKV